MRLAPLWRLLVLGSLAASFAFARPASVDDSTAVPNWAAPPYWVPPAGGLDALQRTPESKRPMAPPPSALAFHAVTPCRIADTRGFGFTGPYGPPSLTAGPVRSFAVTSPGTNCNIPSGVAAVSLNFAATTLSANGNLIVYPTGGAAPTVSSLNWTPVEIAISNAAVIPLGSNSISVVVNGPAGSTADLIIDVNGYYQADPVVTAVNGISNAVALVAGGDVTVTPAGQNVTIGTNASATNVPNTLVRRDAIGNFTAGTITAALTGAASSNVLKDGDAMTGNLVMNGGDLDLSFNGRIVRDVSLFFHSPGNENTFAGLEAGRDVTAGGTFNAGFGANALHTLTGGLENVAVGAEAGAGIVGGSFNVAVGDLTMTTTTFGTANVAVGSHACGGCTGNSNTAIGYTALTGATGNGNIAIGSGAGTSLTSGSNNIYIGHSGAAETNTIRIGTSGIHLFARMAGINGSTSAGGVAVLVNGLGQLGTTTSSARFKEDVRDVGSESDGLYRLRPVSFRYKPELDPDGIEQFGLIAEEVEKVYPGLVTCGEDGEPQAVRYHFLVPMLLNEVQKDRQELDRSRAELADLKSRLERLESLLK